MDANLETGHAGAGPPSPERHIPLVAEILGYVGGALALGAVVALLTAYWVQIGFYGREAIAAGLMLAGLVGGYAIARSDTPAANRLSQFLLFIGVVGAGAMVGFGVYELILRQFPATARVVADVMFRNKAADWAVFSAFGTAAVVGGAVWWGRRTVLQHLAFGLGVGIGTLLLLPLLPVDGPDWGAGAVLALLGLAWGALGLKGWLPPEPVALSLASLGVLGGIEMMNVAISQATWQAPPLLWLGLVVSIAIVVGGLVIKRTVLLGFGATGIAVYAYQLIDAAFRGTIWAPVALLVAGLVFVGMAVFVAVRLPRMKRKGAPAAEPVAAATVIAPGEAEAGALVAEGPQPEPIPLAAEILGYVGGAFAVGAAIALMVTFWTPLGLWGRLAVAAVGALLGIAGGFAVGRQGSPGAHRLEQFMLAIGTIAVGFFVGVAAYELLAPVLKATPEFDSLYRAQMWAQSIGFWSAAIAGFAVWWSRRTGLQLAILGAACFSAIGSTADNLSVNNPAAYWYSGAAILVFAALFWAGALLRFLKPESIAYAFGSGAVYLGLLNLMYDPGTNADRPVVMWIGLAASIAMIVASIPMKRGVILGFGAGGVVLWSVNLVNSVFGERMQGPVLLLVIGVVFVAMAVLVGVLLPRFRGAGPGERSTPRPFGPHAGAPA